MERLQSFGAFASSREVVFGIHFHTHAQPQKMLIWEQ